MGATLLRQRTTKVLHNLPLIHIMKWSPLSRHFFVIWRSVFNSRPFCRPQNIFEMRIYRRRNFLPVYNIQAYLAIYLDDIAQSASLFSICQLIIQGFTTKPSLSLWRRRRSRRAASRLSRRPSLSRSGYKVWAFKDRLNHHFYKSLGFPRPD